MKQVVYEGVAAVREESRERERRADASSAEHQAVLRTGGSRPTDEARCSVDPMRQTDRYRLVTPYFDSSKDL